MSLLGKTSLLIQCGLDINKIILHVAKQRDTQQEREKREKERDRKTKRLWMREGKGRDNTGWKGITSYGRAVKRPNKKDLEQKL